MTKSHSTLIVLCLLALFLVSCGSKSQTRFSAESLRFIPGKRALVLRLRNEEGGGPVRYLIVKSLPDDYANSLGDYLNKHAKSISGGLVTVEAFWGTWSNTEHKRDHLNMMFRRPLAPGEVDTSWGTYLPYRSVSIVGESGLPPSLVTNRSTEVFFSSCSVTYTDQRVKSFGKYQPGP